MAKLHEVLAVEGQLKGQAQSQRKDLMATFKGKHHLFEKKLVTFQPIEDGAAVQTEAQSELESTVPQELAWISGILGKSFDVSYQVSVGNTTAKADVVMESGEVLLRDVPATALLELEKRANEIQELVSVIPTLDPAKGFSIDPDAGNHVYKAREVVKQRTKKAQQVITLAPATEHHAAQAQLISVDVPTGLATERHWSSMLTVTQKADMLERAEALRRAIKQARMRANDAVVETKTLQPVGATLCDFVFGQTAKVKKDKEKK